MLHFCFPVIDFHSSLTMSLRKDLKRHGAEKAQAIVAQRQKQQEHDDEDTSNALLSCFVCFQGEV